MSIESDRHEAMNLLGCWPDDLDDCLKLLTEGPREPAVASEVGSVATKAAKPEKLDLEEEFYAHCVDFGD